MLLRFLEALTCTAIKPSSPPTILMASQVNSVSPVSPVNQASQVSTNHSQANSLNLMASLVNSQVSLVSLVSHTTLTVTKPRLQDNTSLRLLRATATATTSTTRTTSSDEFYPPDEAHLIPVSHLTILTFSEYKRFYFKI